MTKEEVVMENSPGNARSQKILNDAFQVEPTIFEARGHIEVCMKNPQKRQKNENEINGERIVDVVVKFSIQNHADQLATITPKIFVCSCKKTFAMRSEYWKHLKIEKHPRGLADCKICSKQFKSRGKLEVHMRSHTKEQPYQCEICGIPFSLKCNLSRHLMTHTGEKPHMCEICGKGFIQKTCLTAHMIMHGFGERRIQKKKFGERRVQNAKKYCLTKSDKKWMCSTCGKFFNSLASFRQHCNVHEGNKPYVCKHCDKRFSQISGLMLHSRTHTGLRPYICHICGKMFRQAPHLTTHMRIHTGERPFLCGLCGKGFRDVGGLIAHKLAHTGERPHKCDLCSKSFIRRDVMRRHRRKHETRSMDEQGLSVYDE